MAQWQGMERIDTDRTIDLIHLSWQTHVFGFIDDMYLGTENDPDNADNRIVSVQSQLRVGKADMTYNEYYVKAIITCLEEKFGTDASEKMPCTQ